MPIIVTASDGDRHYWTVAVINAVGESHQSNSIFWSTLPPPPTGLSAIATSSSSIDVSYTPTTSPHAGTSSGWRYGTTNPPTLDDPLGSISSPKTFSGLVHNTTYYFMANANDLCIQHGDYSGVVSATTQDIVPAAPVLDSIDTGNPNLTFHFHAGVGGGSAPGSHTLYRNGNNVGSIMDGGQYTPPDSDAASYTVTGTNGAGESSPSNAVSGQIVLAAPSPMLTALSQTQLLLDFDTPATGTIEALFDGSNPPVTSIGSVADNQVLSGIPIGATRYIKLRTVNSLGQSAGYGAAVGGATDSDITISCPPLTDGVGNVAFSPVSVSGGSGIYSGTCTIDPGNGLGLFIDDFPDGRHGGVRPKRALDRGRAIVPE
ncbi:MAG: hypothetical protein K8T89_09565 [Planctomycetes bacterium]|nr:hypothetical protein [Planctomycetota bacterium]